jgi:hypothetical protein
MLMLLLLLKAAAAAVVVVVLVAGCRSSWAPGLLGSCDDERCPCLLVPRGLAAVDSGRQPIERAKRQARGGSPSQSERMHIQPPSGLE